jgi:sarcosine oxidase, subunit delta
MLLLTCPHCGVAAEETEFANGGEAHLKRFGPGSRGCRISRATCSTAPETRAACISSAGATPMAAASGSIAARCTVTLEVFGTYPAQTTEPPKDVIDAIKARRPEWEGWA